MNGGRAVERPASRPGLRSVAEMALAAIGLGLTGLVLYASLPERPHYYALLNDAGHAPVFGALAWVVFALLDRRLAASSSARFAAAFIGTVAIGGLIEVLQSFMDRDASWGDLLTDAAGAGGLLCALALWRSRTPDGRGPRPGTAILLGGIAIAAAIVATPLVRGAAAYGHKEARFPVIASFEVAGDLYFMKPMGAVLERISLPPAFATADEEPALKVVFGDQPWPGVQFWELEPDWRGYSVLCIDLINPAPAPLRLGLRIEDFAHDQNYEDRFNRLVDLPPATRSVVKIALADVARGPRRRALDLGTVARLVIFDDGGTARPGRVFYVRRLWLE
jgi:VanZ family protein